MNKKANRIVACVLAAMMSIGSTAVPALATDSPVSPNLSGVTTRSEHPDDANLGQWVDKDSEGKEQGGTVFRKIVTAIGDKAFFRATAYHPTNPKDPGMTKYLVEYSPFDDGTADPETGDTWHPVPKEYLKSSGKEYGVYVINNKVDNSKKETFDTKAFVFVEMIPGNIITTTLPDGSIQYEYKHANPDGAYTSESVDTATSGKPTMGTDFYINVQHMPTTNPFGENEFFYQVFADSYIIGVSVSKTTSLQATVPMYVCMYGYRGSGDVIAPSKDQYQLKNYSSVNYGSKAVITGVQKQTLYSPLKSFSSAPSKAKEKVYMIVCTPDQPESPMIVTEKVPSYEELNELFLKNGSTFRLNPPIGSNEFSSYQDEGLPNIYCFDSNNDGVIDFKDKKVFDLSGSTYYYYDAEAVANGETDREKIWSFAAKDDLTEVTIDGRTGLGTIQTSYVDKNTHKPCKPDDPNAVEGVDINHPLKVPFKHAEKLGFEEILMEFDFGTTIPMKGDFTKNKAHEEPVAIDIDAITASPASWKLVPQGTGDKMIQGEIEMSLQPDFALHNISALDLYDASATKYILDRGWYIPAPTMKDDRTVDMTKPGILPMIVNARIAGEMKNDDGCFPVTHVEYTISPANMKELKKAIADGSIVYSVENKVS